MKATIEVWNPMKGFGFCRLEDGRRAFVHVSAFEPGDGYMDEFYSRRKRTAPGDTIIVTKVREERKGLKVLQAFLPGDEREAATYIKFRTEGWEALRREFEAGGRIELGNELWKRICALLGALHYYDGIRTYGVHPDRIDSDTRVIWATRNIGANHIFYIIEDEQPQWIRGLFGATSTWWREDEGFLGRLKEAVLSKAYED